MIAKRLLSLVKRTYRVGRRQLCYLYDHTRCWRFVLTEGRRLQALKNIHAGDRCFIIGNGPSIRQQDLTLLHDEYTFVVSWFARHEDYQQIAPQYYCVSDIELSLSEPFRAELHLLMSRANHVMYVFLPADCKDIVDRYDLFGSFMVFYVNYHPFVRVYEAQALSPHPWRHLYVGDTVIIDLCLPLALLMGFRNIYLLGCDCDYGMRSPLDVPQHFYTTDYSQISDPISIQTLEHMHSGWARNVFASYEVVKRTAEELGVGIYNAGIGGKLEVFERVSFEDVLRRPQLSG